MLKGKKTTYFIIGFSSCLFFLRLMNLEVDLPAVGIGLYQPIDEGLYSRMALSFNIYGDLHNAGGYITELASTFRANIFGNFAQVITLELLGDTYWGLRFPYVCFAFLQYIYIMKTVNLISDQHNIQYSSRNILIFGISIYILCDFSFLLLSRVVENSNIRALSVAVAIYYFLKYENNVKKKYFIQGFIAVLSVFFIYFSNVSLVLALIIIFISLIFNRRWGEAKQMFLNSFVGGFLAYVLVCIYYYLIWDSSPLVNFYECIVSFSDRVEVIEENMNFINIIVGWINGGVSFFDSNIFFYSVTLYILLIISLLYNLRHYYITKDNNYLFVISIIFSMLLQSVFTSDYIERKAIVVYPAIIISIIYLYINLKKTNIRFKGSKNTKISIFCFVLFCLLIQVCSAYSLRYNKNYLKDFEMIDIYILLMMTIMQIIFLMIATIIYLKKTNFRILGVLISISLCLAMITNVYFSIKYIYTYSCYSEKEAMIEIGNIVGENYVVGPFAYGFVLYNDVKPIMQTLENQTQYFEYSDVNYVIDYEGGYYANIISDNQNYEEILVCTRSIKTFGYISDIGVYKKIDNDEEDL